MERDARLLIVDVQRDFCSGGTLAVAGGDEVVGPLNRFLHERQPVQVYASRDWHPVDSRHFQVGGGRWPAHCVQNTLGAEFHPALRLPPGTVVISKGTTADEEGYSALDGRNAQGEVLGELLHRDGVRRLYVGGLATDYCIRASVLAVRQLGLEVVVLRNAVRAVDLHLGDGARALTEMQAAGALLLDVAGDDVGDYCGPK